MNLRWRAFEKPLRARLKPYDDRAKMSLWRRFWHSYFSSERQPDSVPMILRVSASVLTLSLISAILSGNGEPIAAPKLAASAVNFVAIWSLFIAILRFIFIRESATSSERRLLCFFPLSRANVFKRLLDQIRFDLGCLFVECLIAFWFAAWVYGSQSPAFLAGLLCAALSTVLSFQVSILMLKLRVTPNVYPVLFLLLLLGCLVGLTFDDPKIRLLLAAINPAGWAASFYLEVWLHGSPWAGTWMALSLLLVAILPVTYRQFRAADFKSPFPKPWVLKAGRYVRPEPQPIKRQREIPAAQARRELLDGDLLEASAWNDLGFIERAFSAILSQKELVLAKVTLTQPKTRARGFAAFFLCAVALWSFRYLAASGPLSIRLGASAIMLALYYLTIKFSAGLFCYGAMIDNRMAPVSAFASWKTFTKMNGLVFGLLLSLSTLAPLSTPFSTIGIARELHGISFPGRTAAFFAYLTIFPSLLGFSNKLGSLSRWASNAIVGALFLGQLILAFWLIASLVPTFRGPGHIKGALDFSAIIVLIPFALATTYLCGYFNLRSFRRAAADARRPPAPSHSEI